MVTIKAITSIGPAILAPIINNVRRLSLARPEKLSATTPHSYDPYARKGGIHSLFASSPGASNTVTRILLGGFLRNCGHASSITLAHSDLGGGYCAPPGTDAEGGYVDDDEMESDTSNWIRPAGYRANVGKARLTRSTVSYMTDQRGSH